ncbi:xanthine dehydrogenase family protein molybdopterin-binding subunit [Ferruginibacter yonginensis]|uniref:Xanthine dehydrogenase family protein molybdopterin-binding subunit n=1 Tax=Ferruginibacter yonginensis TaxID=1310416 RepID=A0ABV8QPJ3_9BACT
MEFFDEYVDMPTPPPEGRVEAMAKVTGKGKYAAEYQLPNMCYGVFVTSTITAGTIKTIQTANAKMADGVIDIITHLNKQTVPGLADEAAIKASRFSLPIFHTDKIFFKGQPIALVIAATFEEATYAASLVTAEYNETNFVVDFDKAHANVPLKPAGKDRGNIDALQLASVQVSGTYTIKNEVHNPMEMHATIAHWQDDGKLLLYDKNQGVNNVQRVFAGLYKMPVDNIQVVSEFVGGGFGSGLKVWPNTLAAAMAAKQVKRPVKVVLTRPQMFTLVGYRPASWQKLVIGADATGKFTSLWHQAKHSTSVYDNFNEGITRISRLVYNIENLKTESAIVPLNLSTPTWMRGPGDCTGAFAVESAIDTLSYQLQQDPVALRLKNLALKIDPDSGKPWSTHYIDECITKGASMIQWQNRPATPGTLTEGDWKIGYGMAVGMWNAGRTSASASIQMTKDGTVVVQTAMTDIGTGTGTGVQNMAYSTLGIDKEKIKVELGNSNLPPAPSQGGSTGLSSISGAIVAVCNQLKTKLATWAVEQNTAFKTVGVDELVLTNDAITIKAQPSVKVLFADIWRKNNLEVVEVMATAAPGEERKQFAFASSAAHFCVVKVNTKTGKVKMHKMVCVADGGTIVNQKAAANQISGACVGGIGMALTEYQTIDATLGTGIGNDFGAYHIPVNADAPIIEVAFIGKPDVNSNPSGSKGLGEVGIIGAAAAIANAIYNATGKRIYDLPITPDKILMA